MSGGIRVQFAVAEPGGCPAAAASTVTNVPITRTARAAATKGNGKIAEEFSLPSNVNVDIDGFEPVFEQNGQRIHRFERDMAGGCVCEVIERGGSVVTDLQARDGELLLSFYAAEISTVRAIFEAVSERFDGVSIRQLIHEASPRSEQLVFVDRGKLTDRQQEVLETCLEMGYFEFPKQANASDVAQEMGITSSTLREHLAAAERKLFTSMLTD